MTDTGAPVTCDGPGCEQATVNTTLLVGPYRPTGWYTLLRPEGGPHGPGPNFCSLGCLRGWVERQCPTRLPSSWARGKQ